MKTGRFKERPVRQRLTGLTWFVVRIPTVIVHVFEKYGPSRMERTRFCTGRASGIAD